MAKKKAGRKPKNDEGKTVRTHVSLHPGILGMAKELKEDGSYNGISELVSDLIRQEKRRREERAAIQKVGDQAMAEAVQSALAEK